MALAAHNAEDRVEQLIVLTRRLTDLIERETHLFTARRPLEAAPFRDEKAKLANIYRQESNRVAKDLSLLDGCPPEKRAALKAETERFNAALEAHQTALESLRTLTEGLVKSVADHIAEKRAMASGYGPGAAARRARAAAAVTLDRSA